MRKPKEERKSFTKGWRQTTANSSAKEVTVAVFTMGNHSYRPDGKGLMILLEFGIRKKSLRKCMILSDKKIM